ncbi:hypothetical protein EBZ35_05685 [bacterium]|nr:hypothetical protein [bacterium]
MINDQGFWDDWFEYNTPTEGTRDMDRLPHYGTIEPVDSLSNHLMEWDDALPLRDLHDDPEMVAWLDEHLEEARCDILNGPQSVESVINSRSAASERVDQSPATREGILNLTTLSNRIFPLNLSVISARIKPPS